MKMLEDPHVSNRASLNLPERPIKCSFQPLTSGTWRPGLVIIECLDKIAADLRQEIRSRFILEHFYLLPKLFLRQSDRWIPLVFGPAPLQLHPVGKRGGQCFGITHRSNQFFSQLQPFQIA